MICLPQSRYDRVTGYYWTLSNNVSVDYCPSARNLLTVSYSKDLRTWSSPHVLLEDDTGFSSMDSMRYSGFHYVSFDFLGRDIVYLIRTAYRGANSYHNSV